MSSQPQQNHLLSLKVLRLSKPSFHQRSEIKSVEFLLKDAREEEEFQSDLGVGDFLALPPAFGNIYLGETFTAYLCVNNDSNTSVAEVAFKAELQTTSQRFTLADTIGTTPTSSLDGLNQQKKSTVTPMDQVSLLPRQSAEFILHHEIKELGIHILVCSVHYTPQTSSTLPQDRQRKFFRKFFKFQVMNPFSVKTKVNNIQGGKISLEIQIQNLATLPLCLDKVGFEVNEVFNSRDLNDGLDFKSKTISPQDIRQYLFILSPKRASDVSARVTPNLGKLDIHWKSTMGQAGHLQTSQLVRKVPSVNPFEVNVLEQPPTVQVEKPFKLKLRVQNNLSGERLRLSIKGQKNKMTNILLRGSNDLDIGVLDGLTHHDFELDFFPVSIGVFKIGGLIVADKISGQVIELESLASIRVTH